ncbi:MAG: hypothetical protein H7263_09975 [Candidatus Sericytochromatia bacterium]|nr:hypothetical protein [Candidatus Sericytochromatia bacterium]
MAVELGIGNNKSSYDTKDLSPDFKRTLRNIVAGESGSLAINEDTIRQLSSNATTPEDRLILSSIVNHLGNITIDFDGSANSFKPVQLSLDMGIWNDKTSEIKTLISKNPEIAKLLKDNPYINIDSLGKLLDNLVSNYVLKDNLRNTYLDQLKSAISSNDIDKFKNSIISIAKLLNHKFITNIPGLNQNDKVSQYNPFPSTQDRQATDSYSQAQTSINQSQDSLDYQLVPIRVSQGQLNNSNPVTLSFDIQGKKDQLTISAGMNIGLGNNTLVTNNEIKLPYFAIKMLKAAIDSGDNNSVKFIINTYSVNSGDLGSSVDSALTALGVRPPSIANKPISFVDLNTPRPLSSDLPNINELLSNLNNCSQDFKNSTQSRFFNHQDLINMFSTIRDNINTFSQAPDLINKLNIAIKSNDIEGFKKLVTQISKLTGQEIFRYNKSLEKTDDAYNPYLSATQVKDKYTALYNQDKNNLANLQNSPMVSISSLTNVDLQNSMTNIRASLESKFNLKSDSTDQEVLDTLKLRFGIDISLNSQTGKFDIKIPTFLYESIQQSEKNKGINLSGAIETILFILDENNFKK